VREAVSEELRKAQNLNANLTEITGIKI